LFSVTVSNSVMIAHSLKGEIFGPAQRLHGATYVVEVTLRRRALDANNIVADIGRAGTLLSGVLEPFAYRNLDDVPDLSGRITTTEFLAREIFRRYRAGILDGRLAGDAATAIDEIEVTLREKPDAWASYRGPVQDAE
jgi:6-pyruvoyltetrahydropterin/6-carboxytetrahydropterin synthase